MEIKCKKIEILLILGFPVFKKKISSNKTSYYIFGFKFFSKINKSKKTDYGFDSTVTLHNDVFIEENVTIDKYSYIEKATKIYRNTIIGKFCSIADDCIIGASAHPSNYLSTHPFQYSVGYFTNNAKTSYDTFPSTIIGNDVWIGAGVILKCGITIGNGAIIGSGSVVTKDIPPYAIVVGVPGKILKYRFDAKTIARLQKIKWWNLPEDGIKNLPFSDIYKCLDILERKSDAQGQY